MGTLVAILTIGLVLALLVWARYKAEVAQKNAKADTQDHILEANTFETGHSNITRVTKDPQKYAQIFVPKKKK